MLSLMVGFIHMVKNIINLQEGKPAGVITRQDLLGYLATSR